MKKLLLYAGLAFVICATSCTKFDDLQKQIDEQDARITALESQCDQINSNLASLSALTSALAERDFITSVVPVTEGTTVIGYTINFNNSKSITLYNGKDGETPDISIAEVDGEWFWTVNGKFILDDKGNKVPAKGNTPKLKIYEGKWFVSYDNGKNWSEIGVLVVKPLEIKLDAETITIVLSTGNEFVIPVNPINQFLVPTGIVMLTSNLTDLHRGDTTYLSIRVNPSNFELKEENVALLVSHDIYTCFTKGPVPEEGFSETFDPTVKSEFNVIGLKPDESYEGVYTVAVEVKGEGNYFDDASLFAIAKNKDSKGQEVSVCSATPCTVTVVPELKDGLYVEALPQSFYPVDSGVVSKNVAKPYFVGLWSNLYINKAGVKRVFSREHIVIDSVSDTTFSSLDTQYFDEYGFVTLTPDLTSEYWENVVKLSETQNCYSVPEAKLTVSKKSIRRSETVELDINYKYYFPIETVLEKELSISKDSAATKTFFYDYTDFRASTGYGEFTKGWFTSQNKVGINIKCVLKVKSQNPFVISVSFEYFNPKPGVEPRLRYSEVFRLSCGQNKDGLSTLSLPAEVSGTLMQYIITHKYSFVE